jgi:hypothetical protein
MLSLLSSASSLLLAAGAGGGVVVLFLLALRKGVSGLYVPTYFPVWYKIA